MVHGKKTHTYSCTRKKFQNLKNSYSSIPIRLAWVHADTGNSCKHIGYDDFNPPAGSWPGASSAQRADWILRDLEQCGESTNYPEEFWGCSDIALSPGGWIDLQRKPDCRGLGPQQSTRK